MSFQARTSQFRMTFLVTDYISSFLVPVDFLIKHKIVQPFQGWFEDGDYLTLIQLCSKSTRIIFQFLPPCPQKKKSKI